MTPNAQLYKKFRIEPKILLSNIFSKMGIFCHSGKFLVPDFDLYIWEGLCKKNYSQKRRQQKNVYPARSESVGSGSNPDRPIKQIDLAKMVNDLGGELNVDIWCDRKTVGRHIKLLSAAGYKIVFNKGKGYYLESSNFDLHETELLKSIIAASNISDAKKQALVRKLINQQHNPTKTSIRKFLREETK